MNRVNEKINCRPLSTMAKAKKDVTEMDGNQFPKGFNFADLKSIISVMEESQTEINVSHWTFGIECTVF